METGRYGFLVDTYRTERLKTLGVWAQVPDARMRDRVEVRARTPLEHMVHQCQSEHNWMEGMLGIAAAMPALPASETREAFIQHYGDAAAGRLTQLAGQSEAWFEGEAAFFDVRRTRAWILTRRLTHTAHHRGQLLAMLRAWGVPLYSTYGPSADTGGLPKNGGQVIYRGDGGDAPPALPGPGRIPPTERPEPAS